MKWASGMSGAGVLSAALDEAIEQVESGLEGNVPDLLLVFATMEHEPGVQQISEVLLGRWPKARLVGCSGAGIVGAGREVEREPALSLMAGCLPEVEIVPFHLVTEQIETLKTGANIQDWLDIVPEQQPCFVLMPEPFSCPLEVLIEALDDTYPGRPKVGGVVSGGQAPGEHFLLHDDAVERSGVVGLAMYGDVELDPIVAQGCRPVGDVFEVTRADGNLLLQLNGRSAVEILDEMYNELSETARALFRRAPMLGLGMDRNRAAPVHGDFLIRNMLGVDRSAGVIGVGARLIEGAPVQFHLRDASSSAHDLDQALIGYQQRQPEIDVAGAVLFACLGRGAYFYGMPNHDSSLFLRHMGHVALGGFFCNGEIGPVHGKTYLHGYTSSFGVFRPRGWN